MKRKILIHKRFNAQPFRSIWRGCALTFLLVLGFLTCSAQQTTVITHHMFTGTFNNPAFAGSAEGINVTGLIRQQWLSLKDQDGNQLSPQTYLITIDSPLKLLHGGLMASVMQDNIFPYKNIEMRIGYAYMTSFGNGDFSAGIQLDMVNSKIDFSKLKPIDDEPLLLESSKGSDFVIDAGIGVLYRVPDRYYIGLTVDKLFQTKAKKIYTRLKREYDLMAGYNWAVPGHPAFEIQPSLFFRTDLAAYQMDLSALVVYNKKIWGGLAYRLQDAVSILAGMSIKGIRIGLSYDISTSALTKYNDGSFEIMLNYCFKIKVDKYRKSYKNARFL